MPIFLILLMSVDFRRDSSVSLCTLADDIEHATENFLAKTPIRGGFLSLEAMWYNLKVDMFLLCDNPSTFGSFDDYW